MYFVLTSKIWEDGLLSAKGSGIARFRDNIETTRPLALGSLTLDFFKKKMFNKMSDSMILLSSMDPPEQQLRTSALQTTWAG